MQGAVRTYASEYKKACVVTVNVYHGNNMLGQHRFEFTSRSDSLYRLLYGALDPISFMCEALQISPPEIHELDHSLAVTFQTKAPHGFDFLGPQRQEGTEKSDSELPTLLHFACKYGLTNLCQVLLMYPGAHEACSLKNYEGQRPCNLAENLGFYELADEIRKFQKPDGSYCYILKKQGDESSEWYGPVDGDKDEEHYVKMRRDDGAYYYIAMREGVCVKPTRIGNKHEYANDPSQDSCPIYSNTASDDKHGDGEETYEDMTAGKQEEIYEDMVADDTSEQTPDSFGYVKPTSNRPADQTTKDFNRSASNAAAIRARQLGLEKKSQLSMTAGVTSQADRKNMLQMLLNEFVESGELPENFVTDVGNKLQFSPSNQNDKHCMWFCATISSGSSGISMGSETDGNSESTGAYFILYTIAVILKIKISKVTTFKFFLASVVARTHQSRSDILSELGSSTGAKSNPPPLPKPDYHKPQGRQENPRPLRRAATSPVEEMQAMLNSQEQPAARPPVPRRHISAPLPAMTSPDCPSKELRKGGKSHILEVTQEEHRGVPMQRPVPRRPQPTPSPEDSRPLPPDRLPASVRQGGISVLPSPRAPDSAPPVAPRRGPMPPSRAPR
ncbi:Phosphoinositide 3-kinase adapter protein 1 [Acropora cervicornis]|uniref:Phosphoinositide 3-kinase adapter protein 1 n=1 Tax=Acropora cervicornis TaxID=6130 RepID=A0AAD9QMC7_ACRCE|nr:Phosphoinositide 3-kinase adapter protein 1 [Acropora cervicornis]